MNLQSMCAFPEFNFNSCSLVFVACVGKLGVWSDTFHLTGRLATILASQTDADAEDDYGGSLSVQLPRVGRQV